MPSPFNEQPPRNRLTILHLMLWTLGTAIALGFYRNFASGVTGRSGRIFAISQMLALTHSLPTGARIGGFLLFAIRRLSGERGFPSQPGQWLLVVEGLSALASFTCRSIMLLFTQQPTLPFWSLAISQIPNCLITAAAYGFALLYLRGDSRLWKMAIWGLIAQHAAALVVFTGMAINSMNNNNRFFPGSLFSLYTSQTTCFPIGLAVLVPLAALQDPLRRQRDFLHWAGIAALVCTTALRLAVPFIYVLVR